MIELDKGMDKPIYLVCDFCKHLIENRRTCKAFPYGIPDEILSGKNKHSTPLQGQENKLVFEQEKPKK